MATTLPRIQVRQPHEPAAALELDAALAAFDRRLADVARERGVAVIGA